MESDYQSLFQVRLANYDDIPAIMNITREAFVKYQQMSGVENLAALEESYNDVKKDIDTKVVLLALSDGEPVGSVRVEVFPDKTAYLSRFAVKVTSQNNGIGKSIMNLVDKIMVNIFHLVLIFLRYFFELPSTKKGDLWSPLQYQSFFLNVNIFINTNVTGTPIMAAIA